VKKILEGEREEKELVQQELNQERSFSMENIFTISTISTFVYFVKYYI
jgi:hypothetical protein